MCEASGGVAGMETDSSSMAERLSSLLARSEATTEVAMPGEDEALKCADDVEEMERSI